MKTLLLLAELLCAGLLYATGPSMYEANIHPIAMTDKGDILCRTRFSHNEMGSRALMDIYYSYCLVTNDTILELPIINHLFSPERISDEETLLDMLNHKDSLYTTPFGGMETDAFIVRCLEKQYRFTRFDLRQYRRDQILTMAELETQKGRTQLTDIPQKGLKGGQSLYYIEEVKWQLLEYDFGRILFLRNRDTCACNENSERIEPDEELEYRCFGASFDYINYLYPEQLMEYESQDVTGVLFL